MMSPRINDKKTVARATTALVDGLSTQSYIPREKKHMWIGEKNDKEKKSMKQQEQKAEKVSEGDRMSGGRGRERKKREIDREREREEEKKNNFGKKA